MPRGYRITEKEMRWVATSIFAASPKTKLYSCQLKRSSGPWCMDTANVANAPIIQPLQVVVVVK